MEMKPGVNFLLIFVQEIKINNGQPVKGKPVKGKPVITIKFVKFGSPVFNNESADLDVDPHRFALVIHVTSLFYPQAQARERTITRAQIEKIVKDFIIPPDPSGFEPKNGKLERLLGCTQGVPGYCDDRLRSLVTNELLIRSQMRELGEECTSSDGNYSTALYGSPYPGAGNFDFRPDSKNTAAYQEWQEEILSTGLTFCKPFKHMTCSSISKKCECRPGTVWRLARYMEEACAPIAGGWYCWIPGVDRPRNPVALYDPITDFRQRFNEIPKYSCVQEFDRKLPFDGCGFGLKLFPNNICINKELYELDPELENQLKDFPRLNFGDSCNLEHQTQLYTTTDAEVNDYKIRVKNLKAIVDAKTPFCDLKLFLICGSVGKCECTKPTSYNPGTKLCTIKNPNEICQVQTGFEKIATTFARRVRKEAMEGFQTVLQRECPLNCSEAKFPDSFRRRVQTGVNFCRTCPEVAVIGKNCDKALTLFLAGNPPFSLPIDIPEYDKKLELFVQFSEKAKEIEKFFRLEKNSPCDYAGELEAYRSIRRIKNVEFPDKIFTKQNYMDLMSSMDKIKGQFGQKGLCRYLFRGQPRRRSSGGPPRIRPILLCGPTDTNSICYEPNNTVYFDVLMKRLSVQIAPPSGPCTPHPRDFLKYAEEEIGTFVRSDFRPSELREEGFEYLFNTLENHWIDNSKFCNRTGGFKCTKSVDDKSNETGKCEFSKDLMKEVEAELEVERLAALGSSSALSLQQSNQHLFPTLVVVLPIIILN